MCLCVLGEPGVFEQQELELQVGAEKQCRLLTPKPYLQPTLKCEGGRVDTGFLSTHNQSEGSSVAKGLSSVLSS